MGIRLDWDIDSEASKHSAHEEDRVSKLQRLRGLMRLLLVLGVFIAIVGGVLWLVSRRLDQINQQLENLLANTVEAEVAALRIGDRDAFLTLQRSATDDWYLQQERVFLDYQDIKRTADLQLTGQVTDVEIDGQRGRVQVQYVLDGVPYVQTWFYWRYDTVVVDDEEIPGGWYHVPPDYTFWGESRTLDHQRFVVRYQALDEPIAQTLHDEMTQWLSLGCDLLGCEGVPQITFDLVASPLSSSFWAENDQWQMVIPSPYVGQARADLPLDFELRTEIATLIFTRLVDRNLTAQPAPMTDAAYLREAVIRWFVGRAVSVETESYLIASLVQNYGQPTVSTLINTLQPDSTINLLASVIANGDLSQLNADWRDFVSWRLSLEDDLIARGEEGRWLDLYDTRDDQTRLRAYERYNMNNTGLTYQVVSVERQTSPEGIPQLKATVNIGRDNDFRQDIILFNLVDDGWRRAS